MHKHLQIINPAYNFLPFELKGFDALAELALDMRWSWNHESDELWEELDQSLWELTHNPWVVLQTVSKDKLEQALADSSFHKKMEELLKLKRDAAEAPAWFQKNHARSPLSCVAYFSMEFMLSDALPIYSGGLGNVAGDQLKASSDLGIPVVGVGLLYRFTSASALMRMAGSRLCIPSTIPDNCPLSDPVTPSKRRMAAPGDCARTTRFPALGSCLGGRGRSRSRLYLLDTNDPANLPRVHRGITSELYGGGPDLRHQPGACCWELADGGYSVSSESGQRSAISMKATQPLRSWNVHMIL